MWIKVRQAGFRPLTDEIFDTLRVRFALLETYAPAYSTCQYACLIAHEMAFRLGRGILWVLLSHAAQWEAVLRGPGGSRTPYVRGVEFSTVMSASPSPRPPSFSFPLPPLTLLLVFCSA